MKKHKYLIWLLAGDLLLAGAASFYYITGLILRTSKCPILDVLDLYCAGCGGTRAVVRFLNFDIAGAAQANILYTILGFYMIALWAGAHYAVFLKRPFPKWLFQTWYLYVIAAAAIIFPILRNIPAYPFTLLIPR